eukprot:SAG31_NODE_132_length_23398_cov_14.557620_15_plen_72_part_00
MRTLQQKLPPEKARLVQADGSLLVNDAHSISNAEIPSALGVDEEVDGSNASKVRANTVRNRGFFGCCGGGT